MSKAKIYVYELPQSSGVMLYGSRLGGYVVAHGFKTRAAARAAARRLAKARGE